MARVATAAIALAAWCAAAVGGVGVGDLDVPLAVLAAALAAGVAGAWARRSTAVLPAGKDVVVLTAVTVAGAVGLYLAGWADRGHGPEVARLLPLAVVALSVVWPEPNVLRYSLLLAAGALLGAIGEPVRSRWAVGGALVALAVALVASTRLTAASGPRLGGAPPTSRRRVAGEAAVVLAVVGLLAALAASLLPPPPGAGGGGEGTGRQGRSGQGQAAPAVAFADRLDPGAARPAGGDEVVFRIGARRPDLWRATTYDHWDGDAWTRTPEARTPIDGPERVVRPGVGDAAADEDAPALVQSVTVLARSTSVLVAAARPTRVLLPAGSVLQGADATLYPVRPLTSGDSYLVSSGRQEPDARTLRALGNPQVPADVADRYLRVPAVAPGVRALAAQVAGSAPTAFDRAAALERWLRQHTTATESATAVPEGADPLEAFLLGERAGPPERAATSLAVMLRVLGVPARIAVGFLPGDPLSPGGPYVVRARHTHAWVEVWFPAVGWQRFDPSGRADGTDAGEESVWDRLWRFLSRLWPLAVLVVAAVGAWAARRARRWWRRRSTLPWATRFFTRLERAGAARGRPRRPQETPAEYADGLARSVLPDPRLHEVGALVTAAAFSRHEPPADERARAEAVLREAAEATPAPRWRRRRRATRSSPAPRPTIPKP